MNETDIRSFPTHIRLLDRESRLPARISSERWRISTFRRSAPLLPRETAALFSPREEYFMQTLSRCVRLLLWQKAIPFDARSRERSSHERNLIGFQGNRDSALATAIPRQLIYPRRRGQDAHASQIIRPLLVRQSNDSSVCKASRRNREEERERGESMK